MRGVAWSAALQKAAAKSDLDDVPQIFFAKIYPPVRHPRDNPIQ